MKFIASIFSTLKNIFVPNTHLWMKNKIAPMKWLRAGSLALICGWIAILTSVSFISSGLTGVDEELVFMKMWAIKGIVYACAALMLAQIGTTKWFWSGRPTKVSFGAWHDQFALKVRKIPIITRSLERVMFVNFIFMIFLMMLMSFAPRGVMTLFNFGLF